MAGDFNNLGLDDLATSEATVPTALQVDLTCEEFYLEELSGGKHRIVAADLPGTGDGGSPELPGRLLRFALPPDTDLESVSLEVLPEILTAVEGTYDIVPAPLVAAMVGDSLVMEATGEHIVDGKDMLVYNHDADYDPESCTLVSAQQMGRWKTAEVYYSPFAYNPVTGVVKVAEDVSLVLSYELDNPLPEDLASNNAWDARAA